MFYFIFYDFMVVLLKCLVLCRCLIMMLSFVVFVVMFLFMYGRFKRVKHIRSDRNNISNYDRQYVAEQESHKF